MQSLEAITKLRLEREKAVDALEERFNNIFHAYKKQGWQTDKLLSELGQEFRHDHSYEMNVEKVEGQIEFYEQTLVQHQ